MMSIIGPVAVINFEDVVNGYGYGSGTYTGLTEVNITFRDPKYEQVSIVSLSNQDMELVGRTPLQTVAN